MILYAQAVAAERAAKIARENADHAAGIDAMRQHITEIERQRDAFKDAAAFHKSRADDAEKQRDELLAALESLIDMDVSYQRGRKVVEAVENAIDTIARVKGQQ